MTLIEALKSGKPFKRPSWSSYNTIMYQTMNGYVIDDILAEDYILFDDSEYSEQFTFYRSSVS
jgi:hypothetical protein